MKKFINVLAVMLALVMCLGVVVACADDKEGDTATEATTTAPGTTKPTTTKTPPTTTTAEVTTTEDPAKDRIPTPTVDVPADGVITTAEQLHAVLVNGDVTKDYTVNAEKLDMGKYTWVGMVGYTGTFDFGGCTIENAIDSLFISVLNGTVKNLKLANATYYYSNDDATAETNPATNEAGNLYYSPVVRYAKDVTIQNVTIESSVKVTSEIWTNGSSHGGVVGYATGTNIVIENCHFKGEYTTDSLIVRVGGVVGTIDCSDVASINMDAVEESLARAYNCTNTGTVNSLGVGNDSKAGAVVGYLANAVVVNCANYGQMLSNDSGQTGGVVGYVGNTTYMKNCINTGKVVGASFTGGICAYSNGSARYFENCVNLGNVSSTSVNWGGIIGLNKSSENLTNCFNLFTEAGTLKFMQNNTTGELNPADAATHGNTILVNCANLETVDAIFTAIDNAAPGVFQKTAAGSIELVVAE